MASHDDTPLTADPEASARLTQSLPWIIRNGVGIQIMETLAVGAFLTAYALALGASNFLIGLLAALPHLSQLAQIPAIYTVDRISARRVYTLSGMAARPMFLVIAATIFIPQPGIALTVVVVAFLIRYVAGAFLTCSWNTWMRELVPEDAMGRVFGARQQRMVGIGILVSLAAAGFIDLWRKWAPLPETFAFGIVYSLAFLGGMYAVMASRRIADVPVPDEDKHLSLLVRLREPFQHANFRRLLAFLASWNFAINLAAPFFTVNMLKRMGLDLFVVIALATLSQVTAYLTVTRWGAVADRFSNKAVLRICAPLFITCIFGWTFTTMPDVYALTYPLLILIHAATGMANAGVSLASSNITLKLAPRGSATAFLSASSLVNSMAAGAATMVGGLTADLFASLKVSLVLHWQRETVGGEFSALDFSHWDFFFMFATVIGLYALHKLSLVQEDGEVHEKVVFEHLRQGAWRSLRNLSSIAGLRGNSDYPLDSLVDKPSGTEADTSDPRGDGSPERPGDDGESRN